MKKALILSLVAACGLTLGSCIFLQQTISSTEREYDHTFETNRQQVKDIQQAAQECVAMKWEGSVPVYNEDTHSFIQERHTYPVSREEAAVIRGLIPHLTAAKTSRCEHCPDPRAPYMECTLHFLDANGKTIVSLPHKVYGSDPADTNGCQPCDGLSFPAADYATWQKLIPADIQHRYGTAYDLWSRIRQ